MMGSFTRGLCLTIGIVVLTALGCSPESDDHAEGGGMSQGHGGTDDHEHENETARGPNGGRLFATGKHQLELTIEEGDSPPVFVAWLYDKNGDLVSLEGATLKATVHRLGDRTDVISFAPTGNHLRGDGIVGEPHSFEVELEFEFNGESSSFGWTQHEFRVELSPEAVQRARITTLPAGPAHIDVTVDSPGEVRLNGERMVTVRPRFAGVVTEMRKRLGETVRPGEVIAVIQSNASLSEYNIEASMAGDVVARSGMVGTAVDNTTVLYTLADLSSVWVDFAIYPQYVGVIQSGQPVTLRAATRPGLQAEARVSYVGPILESDTRVSHGRIVLPNTDRLWQPGLYVNVTAIVDHADVAVAVPDEAIVRSKFGPAVFIADGTTFEIQPVTPGRSDGSMTEIVTGLNVGAEVVVTNAFLLKAEIGRGEATHDH